MVLSDHEEADTRLCIYVADDVQKESHNNIVMVSRVDSDVVVIRVDTFSELKQMQPGVSPHTTTMIPYVINLEKKRVLRCHSSMRDKILLGSIPVRHSVI